MVSILQFLFFFECFLLGSTQQAVKMCWQINALVIMLPLLVMM